MPGEFQDGASDRERELGADPQPDVLLRSTADADPDRGESIPRFEHSPAKLSAMMRSTPSGERSVGDPVRGRARPSSSIPGESIMRPMPPNCRTTSGPHPRRPKCRRLGVRMWRRSLI